MIKKIFKILAPIERKRLYIIFGVMFFSAIIEVAGIASILPFLSLITNPDLIQDNRFLKYFYENMNFQNVDRYLIFIGVVVLIILIVSNALVFLTQWGLARFSWMRNHSISLRLLRKYIHQPYKFFLNQNTSLLGKNILSEVQLVVKGIIVPILEIFSRGIVAIFIIAMLVIVEPVLVLALIFVLGGAYALTYRLIKTRLNIRGEKRFQANAQRYKAVNEAFGDIKQVKLMGFEKFFLKRFSKPSSEFAQHNASAQIIGRIPRYIIEIIAFGGIIVVVLYFLATGKGLEEFLPIIGLYAFSTYRLLPALQSIFAGTATMRFNLKSLNALYEDIYSFKDDKDINISEIKKMDPIPFTNELILENITFSYPESKKPILKDLNIKINANTSVAFAGSTGAGKTTIANIILGLLKPDTGRIFVDRTEVNDKNLSSWQQNLGYIPQDIYLQDDTVIHNITFGIPDDKIDMSSVIEAAKIANIHDFVMEQLPSKYDTIVGEKGVRLSGGQKQRIGIARAVYHDPGVLVLDEATSALDGVTEKEVFKAIENIAKSKTLIIIAHRLTTIKDCDVIYVLDNGIIVGKGKYEELIKKNNKFRKIAQAR